MLLRSLQLACLGSEAASLWNHAAVATATATLWLVLLICIRTDPIRSLLIPPLLAPLLMQLPCCGCCCYRCLLLPLLSKAYLPERCLQQQTVCEALLDLLTPYTQHPGSNAVTREYMRSTALLRCDVCCPNESNMYESISSCSEHHMTQPMLSLQQVLLQRRSVFVPATLPIAVGPPLHSGA